MAELARTVRIRGRVQGVFFRQWTSEQATELGVAGWVRNLSDGSVEAHVEGQQADIEQLIDRMRQGPSHARVDELTLGDAKPEGLGDFRICP